MAVSPVAVEETDRRNADAEPVQPRVCGLEQIEPEAGRERVGEVVVVFGRRPVVLGVVPQIGNRSRRVVHYQAVHTLLAAACEPLDPLKPPPATQRGARRSRQLLSRHCPGCHVPNHLSIAMTREPYGSTSEEATGFSRIRVPASQEHSLAVTRGLSVGNW